MTMSCCGDKRAAYTQQASNSPAQPATGYVPPKMWPDVHFEYTGETALTVTGNITGGRYQWARKGEVQLVDYRDASGMMNMTGLSMRPGPTR